MNKKQLVVICCMGIPMILFPLLSLYAKENHNNLGKPASLTVAQRDAIEKLIVEKPPWRSPFDITEVDLNKDGKKEYIAIYRRFPHHSGVEVIRFNGDKVEEIFEHFTNTESTEFKVIKNIPTLIFEESDYVPDFASGKLHKKIYEWDGKTFKLKTVNNMK